MLGALLIKEERHQQKAKHGYTIDGDSERYSDEEMICIAKMLLCEKDDAERENYEEYLFDDYEGPRMGETYREKIKTYSRKKDLIVAGAFIAATLDVMIKQENDEYERENNGE